MSLLCDRACALTSVCVPRTLAACPGCTMHGVACWLAGHACFLRMAEPDLSKRLTMPCACEVAGLAMDCWRLRTSGILLTPCGVAISLVLPAYSCEAAVVGSSGRGCEAISRSKKKTARRFAETFLSAMFTALHPFNAVSACPPHARKRRNRLCAHVCRWCYVGAPTVCPEGPTVFEGQRS